MSLTNIDRLEPTKLSGQIAVQHCSILLVDDDPDCLTEYGEVLVSLGYACTMAGGASDALRQIAEDSGIGIVICDIQMPVMDGITFLDELASRFAPIRPVVPIVVTGFGSLDCAVQAMRFNAVDFLPKPVGRDDLAAALRRASKRWMQLAEKLQVVPGQTLEERHFVRQGEDSSRPPSRHDLMINIRSIIRGRNRRAEFLDSKLFADPTWDMLLDLTLARLEGVAVPVSSACAASQVPYTTALRYVQQLVETGMVRRWKDPLDQRRVLLELEDRTLDAMIGYVAAITARRTQ